MDSRSDGLAFPGAPDDGSVERPRVGVDAVASRVVCVARSNEGTAISCVLGPETTLPNVDNPASDCPRSRVQIFDPCSYLQSCASHRLSGSRDPLRRHVVLLRSQWIFAMMRIAETLDSGRERCRSDYKTMVNITRDSFSCYQVVVSSRVPSSSDPPASLMLQ